MTPRTVRRMTFTVGLGLLLALAYLDGGLGPRRQSAVGRL